MDTSASGVATSKARPPDWPPSGCQSNSAVTQPIVRFTQTNSESRRSTIPLPWSVPGVSHGTPSRS